MYSLPVLYRNVAMYQQIQVQAFQYTIYRDQNIVDGFLMYFLNHQALKFP